LFADLAQKKYLIYLIYRVIYCVTIKKYQYNVRKLITMI